MERYGIDIQNYDVRRKGYCILSLKFLNGAKNRSLVPFLFTSTAFDTFFWPFAKYARLMNFFHCDVLNDFFIEFMTEF